MVYFKAGGRICKACMGKKMQKGGVTTDSTKVKKPITVGNKKKLDPKTTSKLPGGKYPSNWTP
jgi:hypothetical protein